MADKKRNTQRKHIRSEGTYSLDEIKSLTMDDGTRVITSADGDIKRPVCAGMLRTVMHHICFDFFRQLFAFLHFSAAQRHPVYLL